MRADNQIQFFKDLVNSDNSNIEDLQLSFIHLMEETDQVADMMEFSLKHSARSLRRHHFGVSRGLNENTLRCLPFLRQALAKHSNNVIERISLIADFLSNFCTFLIENYPDDKLDFVVNLKRVLDNLDLAINRFNDKRTVKQFLQDNFGYEY